jgi:hypothetical protein
MKISILEKSLNFLTAILVKVENSLFVNRDANFMKKNWSTSNENLKKKVAFKSPIFYVSFFHLWSKTYPKFRNVPV